MKPLSWGKKASKTPKRWHFNSRSLFSQLTVTHSKLDSRCRHQDERAERKLGVGDDNNSVWKHIQDCKGMLFSRFELLLLLITKGVQVMNWLLKPVSQWSGGCWPKRSLIIRKCSSVKSARRAFLTMLSLAAVIAVKRIIITDCSCSVKVYSVIIVTECIFNKKRLFVAHPWVVTKHHVATTSWSQFVTWPWGQFRCRINMNQNMEWGVSQLPVLGNSSSVECNT